MSKLDQYFQSLEENLKQDFKRRRALLTDSDVKGGGNEKAVGEFLQKYVPNIRVASNKQVMDSEGVASDEIDICLCNSDQPDPSTDLIIAEGVDLAVQVKAILDDRELDRLINNCGKLKKLRRKHSERDEIFVPSLKDIPFLVDRVPYFVVAFESKLTLDTAYHRLSSKLEGVDQHLWPDAVFILERGGLMHVREPRAGLEAMHFGGRTLMKLLQMTHVQARGIQRWRSPLLNYFPKGIMYSGFTVDSEQGFASPGDFVGEWIVKDLKISLEQVVAKASGKNITRDVYEKLATMRQIVQGGWPPEALEFGRWQIGNAFQSNDVSMANEVSDFLRDGIGRLEELTPSPRFDVAFTLNSNIAGSVVSVSIRSQFVADLQRWIFTYLI